MVPVEARDSFKCMDCGHEHSSVFVPSEDGLVCPVCGSNVNLVIKNTPRIEWEEEQDGGVDG